MSAGARRADRMALATAADLTTALVADRGSRYGVFRDHARITMVLKRAIRAHLQDKTLEDDQAEALDMICHKIGRIVNGDPDYIDSWDDIAGYARLVADRLRGTVR